MNSITEEINTSLENEKIPDFVSEELPKEEARKLTENDIGNLKKNYMLYRPGSRLADYGRIPFG